MDTKQSGHWLAGQHGRSQTRQQSLAKIRQKRKIENNACPKTMRKRGPLEPKERLLHETGGNGGVVAASRLRASLLFFLFPLSSACHRGRHVWSGQEPSPTAWNKAREQRRSWDPRNKCRNKDGSTRGKSATGRETQDADVIERANGEKKRKSAADGPTPEKANQHQRGSERRKKPREAKEQSEPPNKQEKAEGFKDRSADSRRSWEKMVQEKKKV